MFSSQHLLTNWSGLQTQSGIPRPLLVGGGLSLPHLVSNSSDLLLVWSLTLSGALRAPSAGRWLSLPQLVSDFSGLQLADFLSSPSYIIVQSPTQSPTQWPTQSLEWHVWSSSGNNCHAVHRSLSSGASVYECTMGFFYLVPFRRPSPPTRFPLITAIGMCHFLPVHHFEKASLPGSNVNIQHKQSYW